MKRLFLVWMWVYAITPIALSQSPYELNWKKELPYLSTALSTIGVGAYLNTQQPVLTPQGLQALNPNTINNFDRFATRNYNTSAERLSSVFFYGSHAVPFLFLGNKATRSDFGRILSLYGEAASINLGLTLATKSVVGRPRPYVFNAATPDELKFHPKAKRSFFSGHASMTAVNTFFAAKVFSDYNPDSKWKPVVWGAAAVIPGITAYLRVKAGKHYPSDVITGYAVGATVGILVPQLHRNNRSRKQNLKFNAGFNSAQLIWSFQGATNSNALEARDFTSK